MPAFAWIVLTVSLGPMALLLAFQWLVIPLIIRRKQTQPLSPRREPTAIEHMTPEMQAYFGGLIAQCRDAGFEVAANLRTPGAATGLDAVVLFLVNRVRGDTVVSVAGVSKTTRVLTHFVNTDLPDGRRWTTAAMSTPTIYPPEPDVHSVYCAWSPPLDQLVEFHRRRLVDAGLGDVVGVVPQPDDAAAYFERSEERTNQWVARCGYRWADRKAGVWRFTIKGAYLSVWKMLDPIKGFRLRARDRIARREWVRLGMGQPPATNVVPDTQFVPLATDVPVESAGTVTYSTAAAADEVRFVSDAAGLTVRLGRVGGLTFVRRRFGSLIYLGIMTLFVTLIGWHAYSLNATYGVPVLTTVSRFGVWTYLWLFLFVTSVYGLIQQWRIDRRPVTLRATHAGLAWDGVPSQPQQGEVTRSNVATLLTAIGTFGWTGRTYKLVLHRQGKSNVTLARYLKRADADEINVRLQQALGIVVATDAVV